jgi:hypothetical protein
MKKVAVLSMFLIVMAFAGVGQAATVTTYTSYVSWLGAIQNPPPVNENFEDLVLTPGFSITEVGGAGSIHDGVYENIVDSNPLRYQIFNYFPGMTAWGGFFDLANPGGQGTSINVSINDNAQFVFNIPNTTAGQFYGFTSDTVFTGVLFADGGGSGVQETYYSIDMSLSAVPLPPSVLLLGSGLLGLGLLRFRRKNSA